MNKSLKKFCIVILVFVGIQPIHAGKDIRTLHEQDSIEICDIRQNRIHSMSLHDMQQMNPEKHPITFTNSNTGNFSITINQHTIFLQEDLITLLKVSSNNKQLFEQAESEFRTLLWTIE